MNIVWFRRDLRISDNDALWHAVDSGQPTIGLFTLDPWFFQQPEISETRVQFLFESLQSLVKNFEAKGSKLYIIEGTSVDVIKRLLSKVNNKGDIPKLYFNRDIQVQYGIERDQAVLAFCNDNNIKTYIGLRSFLMLDGYSGQPSASNRNWAKHYYDYQSSEQYPIPQHIMAYKSLCLDGLVVINSDNLCAWAEKLGVTPRRGSDAYIGGERAAHLLLKSFVDDRYAGYHWKISRPYLTQMGATSRLSPHFTFGTISTRTVDQVMYAKKQVLKVDDPKGVLSIASFLDRLRWCDSFSQRLYERPDIMWKNRYKEFDTVYTDEPLTGEKLTLFNAWCSGTTGYSLLDASMRQLNRQGWMNFRMRAQAATMLTIIFGVSWHHGARYFMHKLIDGDIAINHWQWQMQAGVTNPLNPIMRIYNPSKNLETKDPDLQYVHFWLPETMSYKTPAELLASEKNIVDFGEYRKKNGKIIADIRKEVRQRLLTEKGSELLDAEQSVGTVKNYTKRSKQRYDDANK